MNIDTESRQDFLLSNVGAPFLIGAAVGFFAKKAIKLVLFFGGLAVVLLFVMENQGITTIDDSGLQSTADVIASRIETFGLFLKERLEQIPSQSVSAVVGFGVGFKFG